MIRARQCLILVFMLTFKEEFGNKSCDLLVGGKSPSGCKPPHSFLKKILINLKHRQPARPLPSVLKKLTKVCFSETTIFSQIHPLPSPANPRKFPINETTTKIKLGGKHVIQLSLHSFHWKQIKFANIYSKYIIFSLQSIKNAVTNNLFGKENSKFKFFFVYEGTLWMATVTSPSDLTRRLLKKRREWKCKILLTGAHTFSCGNSCKHLLEVRTINFCWSVLSFLRHLFVTEFWYCEENSILITP